MNLADRLLELAIQAKAKKWNIDTLISNQCILYGILDGSNTMLNGSKSILEGLIGPCTRIVDEYVREIGTVKIEPKYGIFTIFCIRREPFKWIIEYVEGQTMYTFPPELSDYDPVQINIIIYTAEAGHIRYQCLVIRCGGETLILVYDKEFSNIVHNKHVILYRFIEFVSLVTSAVNKAAAVYKKLTNLQRRVKVNNLNWHKKRDKLIHNLTIATNNIKQLIPLDRDQLTKKRITIPSICGKFSVTFNWGRIIEIKHTT